MAARSCYIGSVGDSTMLIAIDGVTGHTSFVEMPHVNDIDTVQQHIDPTKTWVRFYGRGATTTEYLGDGQLGDNLAPADPSSNPPEVYETEWNRQPKSGTQYRIGRDIYIIPSADNDTTLMNGNAWTVVNGAGNVLYTNPEGRSDTRFICNSEDTADLGPFGVYGVIQLVIAQVVHTAHEANATGYYIHGGFFHNNQLCSIRRMADQQTLEFHYVLLKYNFTGENFIEFDEHEDLGLATVNMGASAGLIISTDSPTAPILIQKTADGTVIEYDPVNKTLTETNQTLDVFTGDANIFYNWDVVLAHLSDPAASAIISIPEENGTGYDQLRTTGIHITSIDRLLEVTSDTTPPFADLPNIPAGDITEWGVEITPVEKSSKFLISADYVTTVADGATQISKAVVYDSADVSYISATIDTIYTAGVSPQAKVEIDDLADTLKQAYTVTGFIRHDGVGTSTQVVLIDNTSDMVIGRQMSNPTTGEYYFRCWTPGTKSILARHPTTRNFRVIHDVVPVAEG